ncbi:GFA family protein [Hahella sp. HN01]|uniref:GFA family protein n=1 Tax=Hahella sp. HN01 TaxID=2847262 RepID=UPI001C1EE34D|nr:GFA family protein [Hahella sp. HN01]MBU6954983.1 GFA family protein [Hahella sp. HN01]
MADIKGSCLCGAVKFQIEGEIKALTYCHCSLCRKAHGSAFGAYIVTGKDSFVVLEGVESLRSYRSSSHVSRTFCGDCGSNIQFIRDGRDDIGVAAGVLDDDPRVKPSKQIYCESKAPWHPLQEGIPHFAQRS